MASSLFDFANHEPVASLARSEMLRLIEAFDWSTTGIGALDDWPEPLLAAIRLILVANMPMAVLVGSEGALVYNDGYARFAGDRHPAILGRPIADAWPEAADFLRAKLELSRRGESQSSLDQVLVRDQGDALVPNWLTVHFSPILDSTGQPIAVLHSLEDNTEHVLRKISASEGEARFQTLADTMPQMVWSALPDGFHDYFNARWYEYTGVPSGSTDGDAWNGMFHPDDQKRAFSVWRHSLETGDPYHIEYRLRRSDGEYRWVLGRALPIRDRQGQVVRWFGTCTDIHDSRRMAEEREVLTQELNHRIKNIFSVVTGLVSLSARGRPEVREFAQELRNRIFALGQAHDFARAHGQDFRPGTEQTSIFALIEHLLAPYKTDATARLSFEGSNPGIDDGTATPLGLLFHELATNSAKYGALSVEGGGIAIRGELDGDRFKLVWKERNGPRILIAPSAEGFGSRLIALSVEGQLHGRVERHWEPDGLRVELDLPMAALRRSASLVG